MDEISKSFKLRRLSISFLDNHGHEDIGDHHGWKDHEKGHLKEDHGREGYSVRKKEWGNGKENYDKGYSDGHQRADQKHEDHDHEGKS